MTSSRELVRPPSGRDRIIAGVCAALAHRFRLPVTLVRLAFVVFGLVGAGEIAYLLLWVMIPKADRRDHTVAAL